MANLTANFYNLTKTNKTRHFIETGTYLGEGINEYQKIMNIFIQLNYQRNGIIIIKSNLK